MMKPPQTYIIRKAPGVALWLDGYNTEHEWTGDRKTAWRLRGPEAVRRLKLLRKHHPQADIETENTF